MNGLPIIMTYLIAKHYCKEQDIKTRIPTYFEYSKINTFEYKDDNERIQNIKKAVEEGNEKRKNLINATFNIFDKKNQKLYSEKIILKIN